MSSILASLSLESKKQNIGNRISGIESSKDLNWIEHFQDHCVVSCMKSASKQRCMQVKEIDELRFVLCPKRMNDAQFWSVYFLLAKKYLPTEAFDPEAVVDNLSEGEGTDTKQTLLDLQMGFKRTFDTARETAKTLASRATGALQPVGER